MHMWTLAQALDRGQRMGSTHHLKADLPADFSADYLTQACFTTLLCFFTALLFCCFTRETFPLHSLQTTSKRHCSPIFFPLPIFFSSMFLLQNSPAGRCLSRSRVALWASSLLFFKGRLALLAVSCFCLTDLCIFYFCTQ